MAKKTATQPELLKETPAIVTPAQENEVAEEAKLIDDTPDVVKMDLRKFNKTRQQVSEAAKAITGIDLIIDQAGVDKMYSLLREGAKMEKIVEAKRKELGDPYRLEVERINGKAKELVKPLTDAIAAGKQKIVDYHKEQATKALAKRTELRIVALGEAGFVASPRTSGDLTLTDWKLGEETITEGAVKLLIDDIFLNEMNRAIINHKAAQLKNLAEEKAAVDFFGAEDAAAVVQEKIDQVVAAPVKTGIAISSYAAPKPTGLTKTWTFELTDISQVPREYLQLDEAAVRKAIAAGERSIAGVRIYQKDGITIR